jgi:ABC-2 type transport system ATP-binding protein
MTTAVPAQLVGVSRRFGETQALDGVNFHVSAGEVVSLLGPNGAGKTTLVRILLGLIRPDAGSATLWGLPPHVPHARRRVGVMLQVGRVPETLTVREHVHLFSSYYGSPQPLDVVLEDAGVAMFADRRFGELSGGQRQRALFALAICGAPSLLVMDEPTVGLDVDSRRSFWSGVRKMIDRGTSVLLTTHYIEEADAVSDRVVVLQRGRIIADDRAAAIKQQVAGRKVRCVTNATLAWIRSVRGVQSATADRDAVVVLTTDAEHLARELLAADPRLTDLEITSAGLEEAFLALTGGEKHVATLRA